MIALLLQEPQLWETYLYSYGLCAAWNFFFKLKVHQLKKNTSIHKLLGVFKLYILMNMFFLPNLLLKFN